MDTKQSFEFWTTILSGQLPGALQNQENSALRATGCDCLSTIGAAVFEKLPVSYCNGCLSSLTADFSICPYFLKNYGMNVKIFEEKLFIINHHNQPVFNRY
jgi:hypothetical protein